MTRQSFSWGGQPEEAHLDPVWNEDQRKQGRKAHRLFRRRALGNVRKAQKLRAELVEAQEGRCHYCTRQMAEPGFPSRGEMASLEHLVPLADGGATDRENCRAVCAECNTLKGKLDQAIRALERALREGFRHEIHYYAGRLKTAIDEWEKRVEGSENG